MVCTTREVPEGVGLALSQNCLILMILLHFLGPDKLNLYIGK